MSHDLKCRRSVSSFTTSIHLKHTLGAVFMLRKWGIRDKPGPWGPLGVNCFGPIWGPSCLGPISVPFVWGPFVRGPFGYIFICLEPIWAHFNLFGVHLGPFWAMGPIWGGELAYLGLFGLQLRNVTSLQVGATQAALDDCLELGVDRILT